MRSQLARRLLVQYVASLFLLILALVGLVLLGWRIFHFMEEHDFTQNVIYVLLWAAREFLPVSVGLCALIGWTVVTYYFISKPLRYLDEVVAAAGQLAASPEEPISLPAAMLDTQNELNLVREKALNDAYAAKEAEQRKNDLVVYLAHDLKTPLTSVIGYLTLLRDEPEISQELRAKYTGIALEKAERLEDLINEFFDITRFNLSHLELNSQSVNLTRMLEQITFEFNPMLEDKALSWDLQMDPDVEILCDPDKLERVFDNLFRNAVNYSYRNTEIQVVLKRCECDAMILVRNHGKTIPPEKLKRIFEQFFRLDSSRSTDTGGAGLGLAIAKEIVELHGGTIHADSSGESILFAVTLPLDRQKIV